jgi:hypothetical protein
VPYARNQSRVAAGQQRRGGRFRQQLDVVYAQELIAECAGSQIVRVDASHAVAASSPDAVTGLIVEAAKTGA